MQRSGSQKALLVISIISIVVAAFTILSAFFVIAGGALVNTAPSEEVSQALAGSGMTQGDLGVLASFVGIAMIVSGGIQLLIGILGVRAANDNQKIMPVWVLAIIELVFSVLGIVSAVVNGTFGANAGSLVVSLAIAAIILWIANNIKKEAGR